MSLKINLFSPWYSWKIAKLALNNNHSISLLYNDGLHKMSYFQKPLHNTFHYYSQTSSCGHRDISIKQSPVSKSHLFFSCQRKFHMNWTSFKRLHVWYGHFFFVSKLISYWIIQNLLYILRIHIFLQCTIFLISYKVYHGCKT
jgi:hypothetical protein